MPKHRYVVVKAYNKSTISKVKVRSIRREARMMETLAKHRIPHTVGYYGAFQDAMCMYIVMECCSGGDLLEKLLAEGRAMSEKRVVNEVAIPLLISLSCTHKLDLIHRDIKLENIFVDEHDRVKFGDFGLTMSTREERGISPVGTVEYMAPELCRLPPAEAIMSGRVHPDDIEAIDEKVDIWALGVTMYELVTGRSPFEGANKAALKQNIIKMNMKRVPKFLSPECCDFVTKVRHAEPNADRSPVSTANPSGGENMGPQRAKTSKSTTSKPLQQVQSQKYNRSEPQSHDSHGSAIKARHASVGSPAPPLLSPDSIVLVTQKRKDKFGSKLARLLPTYGTKQTICMRGMWDFQISGSESETSSYESD
ncbi:hypothetical protein BSKO_01314 [Bryopsis sp. KO-2023]|nr:hypothetical protein BSKO_01314 [Bryopsis sp. KO-2023]